MTAVRYPVEPRAILECRTRRADGSRERVEVIGVEAGGLRVRVLNPYRWPKSKSRAPLATTRLLPFLPVPGKGPPALGKYRIVTLADGTAVQYPGGA